jgi:hypothetical protein
LSHHACDVDTDGGQFEGSPDIEIVQVSALTGVGEMRALGGVHVCPAPALVRAWADFILGYDAQRRILEQPYFRYGTRRSLLGADPPGRRDGDADDDLPR